MPLARGIEVPIPLHTLRDITCQAVTPSVFPGPGAAVLPRPLLASAKRSPTGSHQDLGICTYFRPELVVFGVLALLPVVISSCFNPRSRETAPLSDPMLAHPQRMTIHRRIARRETTPPSLFGARIMAGMPEQMTTTTPSRSQEICSSIYCPPCADPDPSLRVGPCIGNVGLSSDLLLAMEALRCGELEASLLGPAVYKTAVVLPLFCLL